jgi:hypothetical protein
LGFNGQFDGGCEIVVNRPVAVHGQSLRVVNRLDDGRRGWHLLGELFPDDGNHLPERLAIRLG